MKRHIVVLLCVLCVVALPLVSSAHSGGTDSDGGHYDHSTGEYHYHHGESAHAHWGDFCTLWISRGIGIALVVLICLLPFIIAAFQKIKEFIIRTKNWIIAKAQGAPIGDIPKPISSEQFKSGIKDIWGGIKYLFGMLCVLAVVVLPVALIYFITTLEKTLRITVFIAIIIVIVALIIVWHYKKRQDRIADEAKRQLQYKLEREKEEAERKKKEVEEAAARKRIEAERAERERLYEEARRKEEQLRKAKLEETLRKQREKEDERKRKREEMRLHYIELYEGKNMRDLVKIPPNTILGPDGLPRNPNSKNWGDDYTVYITPKGNHYHKENCRFLRFSYAQAVHIYNADEIEGSYRFRYPCSVCMKDAVHRPSRAWMLEYERILRIAKEYDIYIENADLQSLLRESNPTPTTPAQEESSCKIQQKRLY